MAKVFFRFLRGEINGYYLSRIHNCVNTATKDFNAFLSEFESQQFEKGKISSKNLFGLGLFAGIFLPRLEQSDSVSSLRMSDSHIVDGVEYSERGLFKTESETFDYKHTQGEESPDINTLADTQNRSSLVGEEPVLGYISSEATDVIDDEGKVRSEKVLSTPPSDVAYSDFYGNKFMFLSEGNAVYAPLEQSLYIELFEVLQWIKYNGISLSSIAKLVSVVCPDGLVKLVNIEVGAGNQNYVLNYMFDETVDVELKLQRIQLFTYIMQMKFPQIILNEV